MRSKGGLKLGVAMAALAAFVAAVNGHDAVRASEGAVAALPGEPGPTSFRRLNGAEYTRAIAQIFGSDINVPGRFEPPIREEGLLAIGDSHAVVSASGFEQNAIRAREISAQVMDDKRRKNFLACDPQPATAFDDVCAKAFFVKYGRQLFRRPLSDKQLADVMALSRNAAASTGSFSKGIEAGLASLLSSPAFTFRIERSEADPTHPGALRLDAWTLAERISFLLWDSPPDNELLDAAASGALDDRAGLEAQVARLMKSPRLEQGVRAFFSDMLAYDQFDGLSKDPALFPIYSPQLRDDAKEQSLRTIVDHLLTRQGDYRDLFTTRNTFLTRSLGALYGVRVDYRGFGGWMPYTFPEGSPHAGLLTLPAYLMLDPSHEGRSSPTIRGKVVRENFLCQPVPMPPANVNFRIVQDINNPLYKTARERLAAHSESPACAGCHKITDPIGLSMENYTAVGQYRTQENGAPIDASGTFEGTPYTNGLELSRLFRNSESAPSCAVQRTMEYGVGRKLSSGEERWLETLRQDFARSNYKFPALLQEVATSPAFRAVSLKPLAAPARQAMN